MVTSAIYGGWSGDVSGTWTAAGNPYVVTGDLYLNSDETLTIEPGVDVRFYGDFYFYVYGSLIAEGTENDSIYFLNHVDDDNDAIGDWLGLQFYLWNSPEQISLSYISVSGSYYNGAYVCQDLQIPQCFPYLILHFIKIKCWFICILCFMIIIFLFQYRIVVLWVMVGMRTYYTAYLTHQNTG